jgi:hypothetical protein
MKRIAIAILAGGLSLSALTLGSNAANAAEPCAPPAAQWAPPAARWTPAQPAYYGSNGGERQREIRIREQLRVQRARETARRRWMLEHRYDRY